MGGANSTGLGNSNFAVRSPVTAAMGSIRSSIFSRLWAWRALLAL